MCMYIMCIASVHICTCIYVHMLYMHMYLYMLTPSSYSSATPRFPSAHALKDNDDIVTIRRR